MPADETMRAWRLTSTATATDVLQLDTVPIPEPEPGEVRVRVQAIPLNLNDLERITGGNMMVRPDLPYSPGMEVMGVVDACGEGAEELAGQRVVAMTKQAHGGFAEYAICPTVSTFEMPESIPLPGRGRALLPVPPRVARAVRPGRRCKPARVVLIHAAAGGSGSAAVQLAAHARRAGVRDGRHRREGAAVPGPRRRCRDQLQRHRLRRGRARGDREPGRRGRVRQRRRGGVREVAGLHGVQRPLPHDGVRLEQGRGRRAVRRPPPPRARQPQALRRAARLRRARHGRPGEDRDGLELRVRRARRVDHARDRRARRRGHGEAGRRAGRRVRGRSPRQSRRWRIGARPAARS